MKKIPLIASFILTIFSSVSARALEYDPSFGPLTSRTQNPIYLLFLNSIPESTETLPKGHFQFSIGETVSNLFNQARTSGGFVLDLDMEIHRTDLNFAYGFYPNFEVGLQLPLVNFDGGFLDGLIQDYHKLFGFPNGGRESVPNNQFTYRVSNRGQTLYSVNPQSFGLGDLSLYLKHRIFSESGKKPGVSFRITFKTPTGNRNKGLGSGSPDFHLDLALEKSYKRFHSYTNLGYLVLGPFEPLDSFVQPVAFTFSQAFEINMTHIASVVAQVQGNTPIFHGTGTNELDGIPLDLVIGFKGTGPRKGRWEHFRWEFAFSEDLLSRGPSVDFSVRFNLGARF
jgi:hypothetical protein